MAKIDIYETEKDVKTEALKERVRFGKRFTDFCLQTGLYFDATAIGSMVVAKVGIGKSGASSSRFVNALEKHWLAAHTAIGATFLLMGIVSSVKTNLDKNQLAALGKEDPQQVIIPENLSMDALSTIPIRATGTQNLHKVPQATIKTQTAQLLNAVKIEPQKSL